jgi:hypothetical protein
MVSRNIQNRNNRGITFSVLLTIMNIDLSLLYPPVRQCAEAVLFACEQAGLDVYIPATGAVRTAAMQEKIYGKEQFTTHYLGLAVDIQPHLKCKIHEWRDRFNGWQFWDQLQCEIAVKCGFDSPQSWQLTRDRPHNQKLFGIPEQVLKTMWYASRGDKEKIWKYIDLHKNLNKGVVV